ncbi:pyruvate dehydrogenase E2 component (dihydrolipoamide acetyltransferase) [Saccharopolyspora erythraea NRRL 2338]|nr:pyruvate dehydrogenase E2 component (dihydrolipoamide acetyltransferase) [Saccharopolyspora erythraea NRRL 2338]
MPSLGADMDQGTLVEWLVRPGDTINKGDIIAAVDTNKSTIDVECFETGVVDRLLVDPGSIVPVGTPLAVITPRARGAPAAPPPPQPAPVAKAHRAVPTVSPPVRKLAARTGVDLTTLHGTGRAGAITRADVEAAARTAAQPVPSPSPAPPTPSRRPVSPYARRLATELGVEPERLTGSGPDGAVHARDVHRATQRPAEATPAPATAEGRPESMRRAIAALMAKSKREIPHYYLTSTIDVGRAVEWLHEHNRHVPVTERLVPAALLLKAAALAARGVPELNGHWVDDRLVPSDSVHLGVAVSLHGGGLLTPTLADADQLPLSELMHRLRDVVARARAARLRSSDTTTATITVTNLGELGVESVQGVIYPPQVGLVGFGAVMRRPWAVGELIGIRPVVTATLSGDHRASDGATGARFLNTVDAVLQRPEEL